MGWYIGRRLMQMIPVFFGATLLIYAMVFAMPGDPILALSGQHTIPPAVAAQIRSRLLLPACHPGTSSTDCTPGVFDLALSLLEIPA